MEPSAPAAVELAVGLVRVRLAATSATAPTGRRAEATVVRLTAAGRGAGGEGHQTFELGTRAARTGDLLLASHELLKLRAASGAAVVVDRHGKEVRRRWAPGQGARPVSRSLTSHRRRATAASCEAGDEAAGCFRSKYFPVTASTSGEDAR